MGLVLKGTTPKQLSNACNTSYSMYADMKTIRKNDIIFVHAGQRIYGAFRAITEFCEDSKTPKYLLSNNIHYFPDPKNKQSGWKNHIKVIPKIGFYRKLSISHFIDANRLNLCFEDSVDSNEIFDLKLKKKIWSVPERWLYTEASRTVRPITEQESLELLKILERMNADNPKRRLVKSFNPLNYLPIQFVLNPNIVENEKIIEGWVLENIGRNTNLDTSLGQFTSFGNNMPAAYLQFMDIFGYQELPMGLKIYKVIEVKKEECAFPNDINQLLKYVDWVVENIANGDYKLVEGAIIAKDFNTDCINFVKNSNSIGTNRKIRLVKFNYSPPLFATLNITRLI